MGKTLILIKNNIRIYASDYTDVAQEGMKAHQTLPLASLALSTAIAVFSPVGIMKKEGSTSIFYKFNGALKNLLVETNVNGNVRALVGNPFIDTDFDNKDVNQIPIRVGIGEVGTLKIVHKWKGQQFGGEVPMANGDITTDLAYYFDQSEQIRSAVISDVKMKDKNTLERAYSFIFQLLPTSNEKDILWIENFIKNNKLSNHTFEEYTSKINGTLLETKNTRWKCKCSTEKLKSLIELIPNNEKEEIIKEHGKLEAKCNFCNKVYKY